MRKPFSDPTEIPPNELVAQLCSGAAQIHNAIATDMHIVRLGWTPTKEQREAAHHAGFRLLGPGELLA
jgi:hypothetical protein